MFIPSFTSGTASGALLGVSNSLTSVIIQAPFEFFLNGILGTGVMNFIAQAFNVVGNIFAGLV